ncbi:hypothetical protein M2150_001822, partial [Lachnospiraceae bacterium PM6-15]
QTSYRLIVGNNFNSAVLKTACFCQGTDYGAFTYKSLTIRVSVWCTQKKTFCTFCA